MAHLPTMTRIADEVAHPFHRAGWIYEEKYDGWRVVADKDGDQVRLISRQGKDFTRRFPELAAVIKALRFCHGHPRRCDRMWMRNSTAT